MTKLPFKGYIQVLQPISPTTNRFSSIIDDQLEDIYKKQTGFYTNHYKKQKLILPQQGVNVNLRKIRLFQQE